MTRYFLLAAAAVAVAMPATAAPAARPERTLSVAAPAAGAAGLYVEGADGRVEIVAGGGDRIEVSVRLSPRAAARSTFAAQVQDWFFRSAYQTEAELIRAAKIETTRTGDSVNLTLSPGSRTRRGRLREDWVVRAPARLFARVSLASGDVILNGIAGGAQVDLGVGDATVTVPRGDVGVRVNVGDVQINHGSSSLKAVRLSSAVGDTALWINGLRTPAGSRPGAGGRSIASGEGLYTIQASVKVGDALVRVRDR